MIYHNDEYLSVSNTSRYCRSRKNIQGRQMKHTITQSFKFQKFTRLSRVREQTKKFVFLSDFYLYKPSKHSTTSLLRIVFISVYVSKLIHISIGKKIGKQILQLCAKIVQFLPILIR